MGIDRQYRRNAARAFADYARSLPVVGFEEAIRPSVCHAVYGHDDHCPTLRTQRGSDCRCNPTLTFHKGPSCHRS